MDGVTVREGWAGEGRVVVGRRGCGVGMAEGELRTTICLALGMLLGNVPTAGARLTRLNSNQNRLHSISL